jgi:hypothetical protein
MTPRTGFKFSSLTQWSDVAEDAADLCANSISFESAGKIWFRCFTQNGMEILEVNKASISFKFAGNTWFRFFAQNLNGMGVWPNVEISELSDIRIIRYQNYQNSNQCFEGASEASQSSGMLSVWVLASECWIALAPFCYSIAQCM